MNSAALFRPILIVFALALAGCVEDGYSNRPYSSSSSSYGNSSSRSSSSDLSDKQEKALVDGCRARYAHDRRKFNQCVSGNRNSEQALDQGCYMRYNGNPRKLRECLDN